MYLTKIYVKNVLKKFWYHLKIYTLKKLLYNK